MFHAHLMTFQLRVSVSGRNIENKNFFKNYSRRSFQIVTYLRKVDVCACIKCALYIYIYVQLSVVRY